MKQRNQILTAVLGVLLLSTMVILPTRAASNDYIASYQSSASRYVVTTSPLGTTTAQYQVSNGMYSGNAANESLSDQVINYIGVSSGGNSSVSLTVSSSYTSNAVRASISGNGGTLLYVAVNQNAVEQVIWSGAAKINTTASVSVSGLAYVNTSASALLVLGFASVNGIEASTTPLGVTSTISVGLPQFAFTTRSSQNVTGDVLMTFPDRYRTISMGTASVNATGSVTTPVASVGAAAFLKANYPDMVWQGSGSASTTFNGTTSTATTVSRTTEFFGTNGTVVGYAQEMSLQSSKSISVLGITSYLQIVASSTLVVSETQPTGGSSSNSAFTIAVTGQKVVIQRNGTGTISSTATVESQRGVSVNGSSDVLLLLNMNASNSYVLVNFSNNSSQSVTQTSPQSQKQTTITVGSKTYAATQVNVTATGNIVFNVTTSFPSVVVFKTNATGTFQLNSANYWTAGGYVYVFDDPANTYYVANAGTAAVTSSAVQTQTGQSTSTTSNHASTTTSPSSSTSNAGDLEAIAAIVVVVVLIAVGATVIAMRRRKM
jgi:hypothetical protein